MTLYERINNDLTTAMKAKDKFTLSVLRMFKSALDQNKTNQRDIPTDDEIITTLRKQIKLRESSILEYTKYEKQELVDNLKLEIEVLTKYLPVELTEEEVNKLLEEVFKEVNPTGIKDMGNIMKLMTEKIAGRYDMSKISGKVRERLN